MKKIVSFIKKLNPHIVLPCLIILALVGSCIFLAKWAKGVDSEYNRDEVEDGYEIEVLDRVYYMYPDMLGEHIPNETKRILCFGNAPFSDDRDSENNLCNLIAKETGAEVINLSIPDSYMAMTSTDGYITDPFDYYTFYWLMCFATFEDKAPLLKAFEFATGASEIGNSVVDYLCKIDLNTVDSIVLMYDAADYLDGRLKETPEDLSNPATFCGNMYAGINLIQEAYPHIQIIIMSPTYAYAIDEDGNYESSDIIKVNGDSLSAYAITQLNLCQVAEVTFIDHIYGTIHADNADDYLSDNVRLNLKGRKAVADRFSKIYKATWDRYYSVLNSEK